MNDNYSPLMRNTLAGLSETAGALYLDLCDKFEAHKSAANERKAFYAACRYDKKCGKVIEYIIRNSPSHNLDKKTVTSLSKFFAARWKNNFMEEPA